MQRLKNINNRGFTLIEIIASIAILGTVITVLLPIFPQIINWSTIADDELAASNLLSQVAHEVQNDEGLHAYINGKPHVNRCGSGSTNYSFNKTYTLNDRNYVPKISFCQTEREEELGLFRTHIQIVGQRNGKILSDTFIYVADEGGHDE